LKGSGYDLLSYTSHGGSNNPLNMKKRGCGRFSWREP
jgi:hypothetical protein